MKLAAIAAALSLAAFSAFADDRLARFEGGIGVVPVRAGPAANIVRGVNPGGAPWVISRLSVDINVDGRISVDGRGLLLGGTDNIGTNGNQSVRARLFCNEGPAAGLNSGTVALDANGDFRIEGELSGGDIPQTCTNPVLLIVSSGGNWFAAGIPKR